jgi:CelD/BcsL family acetyltransferase involved in cellulose biosynthesis
MISTRKTLNNSTPDRLNLGFRCEIYASIIELEYLRAEWEELFKSAAATSACAHPDWTLAWWSAFGNRADGAGKNTALYVLAVRDVNRKLVGIVPFYEDQPSGILSLRRLRPLGYLGREKAFDMTEEPTLLVLPGCEQAVLKQVVDHLQSEFRCGRWDFVAFFHRSGLDPQISETLMNPIRDFSFVNAKQRSGSDMVALPETWQEYRRQMTKSMRENMPYYPRLLNRDNHIWSIRIINDPDEVRAAVERLASLHQARANSDRGKRHTNHLHGRAQRGFLKEFMSRTAGEGQSFIAELVVGKKVVGVQAFFQMGDTLTVSYSGFDDAFYKYSPIFILNTFVFKEAQERGVKNLNFLRNMAPWKSRWLAKEGPSFCRTYSVRQHPASMVRYGLHTAMVGIQRDVILRLPVLGARLKQKVSALLRKSSESLPKQAL